MDKLLTRKAVDKKTCGKFKTKNFWTWYWNEAKKKSLNREVVRVYWINVAQERVQQPSVLSTVENLQVCIQLCNVFNQNILKTNLFEMYFVVFPPSVAYPGILFGWGGGSKNSVEDRGQTEWGCWGGSLLVRGSGGSCNLVQVISFHIIKFS